jgi:hypothetical protein
MINMGMGKNKKARREEAIKKAKQKKIIIAVIVVLIIGITAALIISNLFQSSGGRTNGSRILDFTRLSETIVIAEMIRIAERPDSYLDRTIKASGVYNIVYDERLGRYRHFIMVVEPDICCPKREFELIWNGDFSDFPEDKTEIEVVGVFKKYEEGRQTYYYLEVDNIIVLE